MANRVENAGSVDVIVIGAGVVGLAAAAQIAQSGRSVFVLEKESRVGQGTSSRNSGVLHAGLYYPTGSLKARACVAGNRLLRKRCKELGVPIDECGKWVVAVESGEVERLVALRDRGRANGVEGIQWHDGASLRSVEPALRAEAAIYVPSSGVFDAHEVIDSYRRELTDLGGDVLLKHRVLGVQAQGESWRVRFQNPDGSQAYVECDWVVNAAGLAATHMARFFDEELPLRVRYVKGNYFRISGAGARPRCALVYPIPEPDGLGVHLTKTVAGAWLAGPDTEALDTDEEDLIDYAVTDSRRDAFFASVRRYLPDVCEDDFHPDYSGVRPKLGGPGEFRDFEVTRVRRSIHLLGIESPGFTSAPYLAELVREQLESD